MLHAVVMAGGSGTRFWPMSRRQRPKHLLSLAGPQSLIRQTVARIAPQVAPDRTWIVTARDHEAEVRRQLPELPSQCIIGEPCGRDTAPCIGLAATVVSRNDPEATLVTMPADHVIEPNAEFARAVAVAAALVQEDPQRLITFGVKPDRPATGYGYLQRGARVAKPNALPVFRVDRFREKPARELAEQFVASGECYWNSGIFVWSARTILQQLRSARPALSQALDRIGAAWDGASRDQVLEQEYQAIERISIDYAVMERAENVLVIEAGFRWDDVGSWGAIQRVRGSNTDGNTIVGTHCGIGTRECIVIGEPDRLVATLGVKDLVLVQSGNALLVANRRDEESVKQLVALMQEQGLDRYL
jgi:mannose-1-phosphate guanylyltransferase